MQQLKEAQPVHKSDCETSYSSLEEREDVQHISFKIGGFLLEKYVVHDSYVE